MVRVLASSSSPVAGGLWPESLLQYQMVALAIWLVALEFWALQALGLLAGGGGGAWLQDGNKDYGAAWWSVIDFASVVSMWRWGRFFAMVRTSVAVALVQFALVFVRHRHTTVRLHVYSRAVTLVRAVFGFVGSHTLHAAGGVALVTLFRSMANQPFFASQQVVPSKTAEALDLLAQQTGALSGVLYSFLFYACGRTRLEFPRLQRKRGARARATVASIVAGSFAKALVAALLVNAFIKCGWLSHNNTSSISDGVFTRALLLAWVVQLTSDIGAGLYALFMTEDKRMGLCTWFPISDTDEVTLLTNVVSKCEPCSLEEALLSFPLGAADSKMALASFKATAGPGSEREAYDPSAVEADYPARSSLMEFAKLQELQALHQDRKRRQHLTQQEEQDHYNHHQHHDQQQRQQQPQITPPPPSKDDAAAALNSWWAQICEATAIHSLTSAPWEHLAELRQRRMDAVLQAVYSADASRPGFAFWNRGRLPAGIEVARARAFFDLASLFEFSDSRREALTKNKEAWMKSFEAVTAAVDALTIALKTATRNAALEPTMPTTSTGLALSDVFVLGPAPEDVGALDASQRRALAWRAEFAAKTLRRQPWFSIEWWRRVFFSQFQEFDPVADQFTLESLASRRGTYAAYARATQASSAAIVPDPMRHVLSSGTSFAFEGAARSRRALEQQDDKLDNGSIDNAENARNAGNISPASNRDRQQEHRKQQNEFTQSHAYQPKQRFTWEKQWEQQQSVWSRPWVRKLVGLFYRTPAERTSSLLSNAQIVELSVTTLGNLVAKPSSSASQQLQANAVPAALGCLLSALLALEEYVRSPAFLGSLDPSSEFEARQLARTEVLSLHFSLERAVYAVITTNLDRLASFKFPPNLQVVLARYVSFTN